MPLTIATLLATTALAPLVRGALAGDRYALKVYSDPQAFLSAVERGRGEIDCLVMVVDKSAWDVCQYLYDRGVLLPVVFVGEIEAPALPLYHAAAVSCPKGEVSALGQLIEQAIAQFLQLGVLPTLETPIDTQEDIQALLQQQRRLSKKLQERLGYLAVYYNRNPQIFFRNLKAAERQELLRQLRQRYQEIILAYFAADSDINDRLDEFVTLVFMADLSVSEVVEIHMDLMEDFAKQLKLEGWSEDILLDYRLTLLDVIAHLCEMYRRSIPREERP